MCLLFALNSLFAGSTEGCCAGCLQGRPPPSPPSSPRGPRAFQGSKFTPLHTDRRRAGAPRGVGVVVLAERARTHTSKHTHTTTHGRVLEEGAWEAGRPAARGRWRAAWPPGAEARGATQRQPPPRRPASPPGPSTAARRQTRAVCARRDGNTQHACCSKEGNVRFPRPKLARRGGKGRWGC